MVGGGVTIAEARTPEDLRVFEGLCRAYAASITGGLEYQGFEDEMRTLPGRYAPPKGAVWLAREANGRAVGCVALRPLDERTGEVKRMYVDPAWRGRGVGKGLLEMLIGRAREVGYGALRLDAHEEMTAAVALYRSLGFVEIPAYNDDPVPGTVWMELVFSSR